MSEQILACLECQTITDTVGPDGCCERCLLDSHEIYLTPYAPAADLEAEKKAHAWTIESLQGVAQDLKAVKAENARLEGIVQDALDDYDSPAKAVSVAPGWVFVARKALAKAEGK